MFGMNPPTGAGGAATTTPFHQQLTPPVSPHSSIYGQPNFTAVKMKGLPSDATVQDVMNFFSDYIVSCILFQKCVIISIYDKMFKK